MSEPVKIEFCIGDAVAHKDSWFKINGQEQRIFGFDLKVRAGELTEMKIYVAPRVIAGEVVDPTIEIYKSLPPDYVQKTLWDN